MSSERLGYVRNCPPPPATLLNPVSVRPSPNCPVAELLVGMTFDVYGLPAPLPVVCVFTALCRPVESAAPVMLPPLVVSDAVSNDQCAIVDWPAAWRAATAMTAMPTTIE